MQSEEPPLSIQMRHWNLLNRPSGASEYAGAVEVLERELGRLRAENLSLRNRLGDNLCHLTHDDLTGASDGIQIPPWSEFSQSCERFHRQMSEANGELQGCMTIAQLEAEVERLRQDGSAARVLVDRIIAAVGLYGGVNRARLLAAIADYQDFVGKGPK